jgi:hypothetical protein
MLDKAVIADKLQKMEETLQLLIDGTANIKNSLGCCYENKRYNSSSLFTLFSLLSN